jgi:hypothetical protein
LVTSPCDHERIYLRAGQTDLDRIEVGQRAPGVDVLAASAIIKLI